MELPSPDVLARMPLAEAALLLWRWVTDGEAVAKLFERCRQRSYEKVLTFPMMLQLISDALLRDGGSARLSFRRAQESGELRTSLRAAYGKLGRIPISLSKGFLAETSDRLRAVFPAAAHRPLPASFQGMTVLICDGKVIKNVAKRLKLLRGVAGGLLAGRALVARDWSTRMCVGMEANPDGDASEAPMVPALLQQLRQRVPEPRVWVLDRQFGNLVQTKRFLEHGDHFVVRRHGQVPFFLDRTQPSRCGKDCHGRPYTDRPGWLGKPANQNRRYVRRIALKLPRQQTLEVITDLLDADQYPATEVLDIYAGRWSIEQVFQEVTQVFGLERLIGGSPQAALFQFAFCVVMYNVLQTLRGYIAAAQKREADTISTQKLFDDVEEQLIAWRVMVEPELTVAYYDRPWKLEQVQVRLQGLLREVWTERWIKDPTRKRAHSKKPLRARSHASVYRILQEHREKLRCTCTGPPQ